MPPEMQVNSGDREIAGNMRHLRRIMSPMIIQFSGYQLSTLIWTELQLLGNRKSF